MYLERAYRQVALISYGNEFLTGVVTSEILDRHPLLFTHFPILRDLKKGSLLAGSASHLLNHLKVQGLHKISLHFASDVFLPPTDSQLFDFYDSEQDFCIVCHFPNQMLKVLVHVDEKPLWQDYDANQFPLQSNYNNYYDCVENYVLLDVSPDFSETILADLHPFSWQSFYEEYQNKVYDFDISKRYGSYPVPLTENNCYEGDLYQKKQQYPLLPFSLKQNYASNLIINASALNHAFNVESHAKNEYAEYWHMSEVEKSKFSQADQTLSKFFQILLKHSANHYQNATIDSSEQQSMPFIFTSEKNENLHNNSTSNLENSEHENLESNEVSSGLKWFELIKFLWFMLWCCCALWALAYFTVRWGNILVLFISFLYALYKTLPKSDKPADL